MFMYRTIHARGADYGDAIKTNDLIIAFRYIPKGFLKRYEISSQCYNFMETIRGCVGKRERASKRNQEFMKNKVVLPTTMLNTLREKYEVVTTGLARGTNQAKIERTTYPGSADFTCMNVKVHLPLVFNLQKCLIT